VIFDFTKIGEEELKMLANDTLDKAYNVRNAIRENWNQEDQEWISIYEEWLTLLKKCGIDENNLESKKDYEFANKELTSIYNKIRELNRKNSVLKDKFS
jgi:type I restriction enzyme R subunit